MKRWIAVVFLLSACTISCASARQTQSSEQKPPEVGHASSALNLAMGQWRFVTIGKTQVTTLGREQPYLKFEGRNGTMTGFTGCNRLRGEYEASESRLSLKEIVSTKMACTGENNERQVLDVLNSVTGYKIIDHELHLLGKDGTLAILIRPHEEQTTGKS